MIRIRECHLEFGKGGFAWYITWVFVAGFILFGISIRPGSVSESVSQVSVSTRAGD
jgi:hypothetical protein